MLGETVEDLKRRYTGGMFIGTFDGRDKVVYIFDFHGEIANPVAICKFVDGKNKIEVEVKKANLREVYPPRGLYNIRDGKHWPVVMYSRSFTRQWSHGLRPETAVIVGLFDKLQRDIIGTNLMSGVTNDKRLAHLFEPYYPKSLREAMGLCESNIAVACTPDFGIVLSPLEDNFLLTRRLAVIGKIIGNDAVQLGEASFAQEFNDYLNRSGQHKVRITIG